LIPIARFIPIAHMPGERIGRSSAPQKQHARCCKGCSAVTILALSKRSSILVISDRLEFCDTPQAEWGHDDARWENDASAEAVPAVMGSYLERLPLACIAAGLVEQAEIWHHVSGGGRSLHRASPLLTYRGVPVDGPDAPFRSSAMLDLLSRHGAPHILVVLGLGVDTALLDACANSVRIYNSIDAPALRVPEAVSAKFDIILTGAQWQSDAVQALHPEMTTAILPIGPEFASEQQFSPLGLEKDYDLIYVAAAQPYKRHDLLLDALAACPRDVRALCLFGYGELADAIRVEAAARGLAVDCIGPPGCGYDEVNRLMNRAKFGVVCGRDDGAPAILTEYMLAGLPVLANAELVCGRQYLSAETGQIAAPGDFADAIMTMRAAYRSFNPREAVLARWTWPHSVERLRCLIDAARAAKPT
jgi:glycosyltransferase involved in cell wall biosynthesis